METCTVCNLCGNPHYYKNVNSPNYSEIITIVNNSDDKMKYILHIYWVLMAETDKLSSHIPFSCNLTIILNQAHGYLYFCKCFELRIRTEVIFTAPESFHKR